MKAINIVWNVNMDLAFEKLDEMKREEISKILEVDCTDFTTAEIHDYAYDVWHHSFAELCEFMGLPDEAELPDGYTDDKDICDYLSDTYGAYIEDFDLVD